MSIAITQKAGFCTELRRLQAHVASGGAEWRPGFAVLALSLDAWAKVRTAPDGRTASLAAQNGIGRGELQRLRAEIQAAETDLRSRGDRSAAAVHLGLAIDILNGAQLEQ